MAKIMIVDDAAFVRTMLRNMLQETGHEIVAEAADGAEAVRLYSFTKPDIVTMDITMPHMDGITAVASIVKHDPSAKIIMCSALGQHMKVIQAITAGAKDFIVKPFHKDRIETAISKALAT